MQIERRLAPFWRGLNDFSESWTEHQLVAAARGLPIPPPDQIPPELENTIPPKPAEGSTESPDKGSQYLTVPISSRSPSFTSDISQNAQGAQSLPSTSPIASGTSSSPIFRGRAKTLAALATSKGNNTDMTPREIMLPHDPFVNGQPIEAYLYKDATECPICFLYYPPYLNRTRCCDQPICSECFVQIKRPDPHPPEHGESNANASSEGGEQQRTNDGEWQLVSEPAACPFCVQPEFGVTYSPPPFRRGLVYATSNGSRPGQVTQLTSPVSSTSSLASSNTPASGSQPAPTGRRRATSLSANDPSVITTDMIRPDWAQKLANARAQAARRAAAATALHTAAYLMNSNGNDSRNSGGRRGVLRRTGGGGSGSQSPSNYTGSPALHALAFLSERRGGGAGNHHEEGHLAPPRGSSRRSRIDDLEEMMVMEAIRMSLASEEERRRKAEKEAKKEAKRKEKEAKKAEKAARKNSIYGQNPSSAALMSSSTFSRVESSSSSVLGEESSAVGKGKGVERVAPGAATGASDIESGPSSSSPPQFADPSPSHGQLSPTEPSRPSHLRHMSNVSSASSSIVESTSGEQIGSGAPPNGANPALEPMFNFRSLAAVIGDEEKRDGSAEHVKDAVPPQAENSAAAEAKPSNSENAMAVESRPRQEDVAGLVPKELEANSVEIPREATT